MDRYLGLNDFYEKYIEPLTKNGYPQRILYEYHIQVLQKYRIAAAFAIPVLYGVKDMDINFCKCIGEVLAECKEVLADESIYVVSEKNSPSFSEQIEEAIKKADVAIAHAANVLNNILPYMQMENASEQRIAIVSQARDICGRATKRISLEV